MFKEKWKAIMQIHGTKWPYYEFSIFFLSKMTLDLVPVFEILSFLSIPYGSVKEIANELVNIEIL